MSWKCEKNMCVHKYENKTYMDIGLFFFNMLFDAKRSNNCNPTTYPCFEDEYGFFNVNEEVLDEMFNQLFIHEHVNINFLLSKRGFGKTSLVNHFLNMRTRNMNEQGYTWIRIDVAKIYDKLKQTWIVQNFETYFYLQLLYVYLRYTDLGENDFHPFIITNEGNVNIQNLGGCEIQKDTVLGEISFEEFKNYLQQKNINPQILDEIIIEVFEKENFHDSLDDKPKEKYVEIGRYLFEYIQELKNNEENNINDILIIIDGIDNISYDLPIREKMYNQLLKFINEFKHYSKLLIIAREEFSYEFILNNSMKGYEANEDNQIKFFMYRDDYIGIDEINEKYFNQKQNEDLIILLQNDFDENEYFHLYKNYIEESDFELLEERLNLENIEEERIESEIEKLILHGIQIYFEKNKKKLEFYLEKGSEFQQEIPEELNYMDLEDAVNNYRIKIEILKKLLESNNQHNIKEKIKESIFFSDTQLIRIMKELFKDKFGYPFAFDRCLAYYLNRNYMDLFEAFEMFYSNYKTFLINALLNYKDKESSEFNRLKKEIYNSINVEDNITLEKFIENMDLRSFFYYDIREMLIVIIKSFQYYLRAYYFMKKKFKNNIEYFTNQDIHKINPEVVLHAYFKSGNMYCSCKDDISFLPPYRNIHIINIFNIFSKKNISYSPIAYYLVLKYIDMQPIYCIVENTEKNKIINNFKVFSNEFKFVEDNIEDLINIFLEYGYVKIRRNKYFLTKKGKLLLNTLFNNIYNFHTNIYNGLIHEKYSRYISKYKRDFSDFVSNAIVNSLLKLLSLKQDIYNIKIEKVSISFNEILKEILPEIIYLLNLYLQDSEKIYLKDIKNIGLIKKLKEDVIDEINELINILTVMRLIENNNLYKKIKKFDITNIFINDFTDNEIFVILSFFYDFDNTPESIGEIYTKILSNENALSKFNTLNIKLKKYLEMNNISFNDYINDLYNKILFSDNNEIIEKLLRIINN